MDALDRLIHALAERAVEEYLTPEPASDQADDATRTYHPDLPDTSVAA